MDPNRPLQTGQSDPAGWANLWSPLQGVNWFSSAALVDEWTIQLRPAIANTPTTSWLVVLFKLLVVVTVCQ